MAGTRGNYFKGAKNLVYATVDGGATVTVRDSTGATFNQQADGVLVRTEDDFWPRSGGAANGMAEVTLNTKDLSARGVDLSPGQVIYDVVLTLFGAGGAAGKIATMTIPIALVTTLGGSVDNNSTDVEGGDLALQAVKSPTDETTNPPYTWAVAIAA